MKAFLKKKKKEKDAFLQKKEFQRRSSAFRVGNTRVYPMLCFKLFFHP